MTGPRQYTSCDARLKTESNSNMHFGEAKHALPCVYSEWNEWQKLTTTIGYAFCIWGVRECIFASLLSSKDNLPLLLHHLLEKMQGMYSRRGDAFYICMAGCLSQSRRRENMLRRWVLLLPAMDLHGSCPLWSGGVQRQNTGQSWGAQTPMPAALPACLEHCHRPSLSSSKIFQSKLHYSFITSNHLTHT